MESKKQYVSKTSSMKEVEDETYGDDFENYEDDFESEPLSPVKAPQKAKPTPAATVQSVKNTEMEELKRSIEMENTAAMQLRGRPSDQGHSKPQTRSNPRSYKDGSNTVEEMRNLPAVETNNKTSSVENGRAVESARRSKKSSSGGLLDFSNSNPMSVGPRMKRIMKLRASGVLEMQEEKFTQLSVVPSSPYDLYQRNLYSQTPNVKQVGVPNEISTRDIDIGTDEIVKLDKEMQYVFGDETSLLQAMSYVKDKKAQKTNSKGNTNTTSTATNFGITSNSSSSGQSKYAEVMMGADNYNESGESISSSNHLNTFLQHASQLFEDILTEESSWKTQQSNAGQKKASDVKSLTSVFSEGSAWERCGGDESEGGNELIRLRKVCYVNFSLLQNNLFITAHPYDDAEEDDLKPSKGIYCIWSVTQPGSPSVVLEASGMPTCCCFSSSQTFLVVAGTAEGSIHMWDLRENNAIHINRDAIDLRIAKGIRKPCYSTLCTSAQSDTQGHSSSWQLDAEQHSCPIIQIESFSILDSSKGDDWTLSSVSQFISLDASGSAIIWTSTASANTDGDVVQDFGLSPWSNVRLLKQRVLRADPQVARSLRTPSTDALLHSFGLLPLPNVAMALIPGDTSIVLLASAKGHVNKLLRHGDTNAKWEAFEHALSGSVIIDENGDCNCLSGSENPFEGSGFNETSFYSGVSCISASRQFRIKASGSNCTLVLVGRNDGTIDLFRIDALEPIQSWDVSAYLRKNGKSASPSVSVTSLQWVIDSNLASSEVSCAPISFLCADNVGNIFYFDLMVNPNGPWVVESVGVSKIALHNVKMSPLRSGFGSSAYIVIGDINQSVGNGGLKIRKISDSLLNNRESMGARENPEALNIQNASWIGRVVTPNVVTKFKFAVKSSSNTNIISKQSSKKK